MQMSSGVVDFFPCKFASKLSLRGTPNKKLENFENRQQSLCWNLQVILYMSLYCVHLCGLAKMRSLGFSSSRTALHWSTPAYPSCVSEGTGSSWRRPAGTTACGCSGGRSCSRWRCWSTTQIWCKAWPSLTTRTPGRDCWLPGPETSGSACGPCSARNQRLPELLLVGFRYRLKKRKNLLRVLKPWQSFCIQFAAGPH